MLDEFDTAISPEMPRSDVDVSQRDPRMMPQMPGRGDILPDRGVSSSLVSFKLPELEVPTQQPSESSSLKLDLPELNVAPEPAVEREVRKPTKEEVTTWDRVKAMGTGFDRGVKQFTLKVLGMIPNERWQKSVKNVYEQTERDYAAAQEVAPIAATAGSIGGEIAATLPAAAGLGGVLKGATALSSLAPKGTQTLTKYGASALGGAGVLAAQESQRYDPSQVGQPLVNTDAAVRTLNDPLAYALPMAGQKLSTWLEKSRALDEGKQIIPKLMARDLYESGPAKTVSNTILDAASSITGLGKRARQLEGIGDDISKVITKISGGQDAIMSKDLSKFAATKLQEGLRKLEIGEAEMWNKSFKTAPIKNVTDAKDILNQVVNKIDEVKSAVPLSSSAKTMLQKLMKKPDLTVDDMKNAQSLVGKIQSSIIKADKGGLGADIAREFGELRQNLFEPIKGSLSGAALEDFAAAREYTSRLMKMYGDAPLLKSAIKDEVAARQVITSILGKGEKFSKQGVMDIISPEGQNAVKAAKIAQALEAADTGGKVNIGKFIKATRESSDTPELLGESYKYITGLNKHLSSIHEAVRGRGVGLRDVALVAGAAGSAAIEPALLIPYAGLSFIANHSPIKSILGAMTRNLPEGTYKSLSDALSRHLSRGGYMITREGQIQEKP